MLRTFSLQTYLTVDKEDPWSGIFTAIAFTPLSAVHAVTQATPMQLAFGRDAMRT
jgi:hypothetical protein